VTMSVMPKITGFSLEEAKTRLSQYNLSVGQAEGEENEALYGTVIWQSIEAGVEVEEGTVIDVKISLGPPLLPNPSEAVQLSPPIIPSAAQSREPSASETPPEDIIETPPSDAMQVGRTTIDD